MFVALLFVCLVLGQNANLVFPPLGTAPSSDDKMLVLIPGGNVPTENYAKTALAIQEASVNIRLWVIVPSVPQKLCITICPASVACFALQNSVQGVIKQAASMGYKGHTAAPDVFLMGHSLGGICAATLGLAYTGKDAYAALIVGGSYVPNYDVEKYPLPVLTIAGEIDGGLARPGVITKVLTYSDKATHDANQPLGGLWQLRTKPVAIMAGLDHSNFCPGFPVPGDVIPSDVSDDIAVSVIGQHVAAFLDLQISKDSTVVGAATMFLGASLNWTRAFLDPYTALLTQEGSAGRATFCAEAQREISGLSVADVSRVDINPYLANSQQDFENTRVHYTTNSASKTVTVNISGYVVHYASTDLNDNCIVAANEVGCKMASAARLANALGVTSYNATRTCRDVNAITIDNVIKLIKQTPQGQQTLSRFAKRGRPIFLLPDTHVPGDVGPLWVSTVMSIQDNVTGLVVTSSVLGPQPLDSNIFPGTHYCKLLSPARVLDYFQIDGLKPISGCLNK